MHKILKSLLLTSIVAFIFCFKTANVSAQDFDASMHRVVYKGDKGPGVGKNIIFIATDHEYRGEESLPALAKILAKKYGFTCTVVYALDSAGNILPGGSNLRGLSILDKADLLVMFMRFAHFNDEEMDYIDDYIKRGGPIVAFRTSTHAFEIKNDPKWEHYSWDYKGPKTEWKDGFGEYVLGETWVSHYGTNHKQSSRIIIEPSEKNHPIMRGVKDMWVQSGGYTAEPKGTVLARGEVLNGMTATSEPDKTKKLLPVAWIRDYKVGSGKPGRAFTTTHGAAEDILNEGFRRMVINAMFWGMGMEKEIKPNNDIAFVGPYKPTTFNFDGYKANVKPADLAGFESLIMPGEIVKKKMK
ncbi:ThuA domain-containing protein [Dyadobacter luticola]|uniref:ThuA domain-containing protein n=1 Tax=Dyadobacter luticola TaxID=1979387 RepID=A0A5R9KRR1_9BACT|nr:ThuA domain-containing protein [Dyadobacter luticola]TLU98794.1 ThuA domain-containing protein [Dyadobacter luticola]